MNYESLIVANFDIVQTGYFRYSELERMMPFEWEIFLNLIKAKKARTNKLESGE